MTSIIKFTPNVGQTLSSEAFFEFLFSDRKEFIISGSAGVGKTSLMGYIIDTIIPRYQEMCKLIGIKANYDSVVMTATTNKAAEVLANATHRPTQTIHSFMNLKMREDFATGETHITRTTNWRIHQNKIIFIDECSMIDRDLYQHIMDSTMNCKLVYVGDHNQLAPVRELISPVYNHGAPFYELTEQMRNNAQPALMAICDQLRETVASGIFKPIFIEPNVIDLLDGTQMQNTIDQYFINQTLNTRILAYTNKRVIEYNSHIRSIRNLSDSYQTGELLVNNSAVKLGPNMLSVEANIEVLDNLGADQVKVDNEVNLDVDVINFKTSIGDTYKDIKIPTDMDHFNKLIKHYSKNKNWERMFFLKTNFPDLRPRDAATVHKSQGSTYDTVFIDLANISTCNIPNQVARMLYVAFSRARNRVFLYGNLADKYGGMI